MEGTIIPMMILEVPLMGGGIIEKMNLWEISLSIYGFVDDF